MKNARNLSFNWPKISEGFLFKNNNVESFLEFLFPPNSLKFPDDFPSLLFRQKLIDKIIKTIRLIRSFICIVSIPNILTSSILYWAMICDWQDPTFLETCTNQITNDKIRRKCKIFIFKMSFTIRVAWRLQEANTAYTPS